MKRFALPLLKELLFPFVLLFVALLLCIQNYTPGTFLSGWDTLHPEFNFQLNSMRTLFGVFRPEQGLGAVAAHAHMVELPRIFVLYILNFFFPLSLLRYLYVFLCLAAGPIGMYFFLYKVLIKKRLPSFLGALFYLLNLGTYQTFLVPFEMFTTLFATLPYVFWFFADYLKSHRKRTLIYFAISIIITSAAAYASTLWFIFFLSLLLFFTPYVFIERAKIKGIQKRFIVLLVTIVLLNLYWLLPNIYFALTQGSHIASANINKLFSEEAFLKNKEFGNIKDILLLRSFYFDWGIYNYKTGGFEQLTRAFQTYLTAPILSSIGYIFASFFLIGFLTCIKFARKYLVSFVLLTLFCLLFLMNANQPFTLFFSFLQDHVPLFKEALRFPDDKILNIFIFLVAIFFAYSQLFFLFILRKKWLSRIFSPLLGIVISMLLIFYMLPAFSGNLIHPFMRVRIPLEYFSLFDALKNENNGRVANLPVNSPWGWVYHNWYGADAPSFQGAGFLYFGTAPSIMERDFDRWNPLNEQYYRELSHAVYADDKEEFKNVIRKYDISHVFIDTSVFSPGADEKILFYNELFKLLDVLQKEKFIANKKTFGNFLSLYEINKKPLISTVPKSTAVKPITASYYKDVLYEKLGDYISEPTSKLSFPLVGISDNESKIMPGLLTTTDTAISFEPSNNVYTLKNTEFTQTSIPSSVIAKLTNDNDLNVLSVSLYPQTPLFDNASLLAPIKGTFEYPKTLNALLSINRQVFSVRTLAGESPTAIGTVFLNSTINNVALFDAGSNTNAYSVSDIPFSFGYCKGENNSALNILAHPDSIVLRSAQQDSVCIKMPLSFIKTPLDTSTTLITLGFVLKESASLSVCLTNPVNGACVEYLPVDRNGNTNTIRFALNKNDLSNTQLILNVPKGAQEQTLSRLSMTSEQAVSESLLTSTFFKTLTPDRFKTVTLPKIIDSNYFSRANETTSFNNDCKSAQNVSTKEFINEEQMYRYSSANGSYCDHISFPNLPHSLSYLVYVKSKNEAGLPMNFCITNYTSRKCDIYSKLTKFSDPREDVFVLPPSDTGSGYDVNFENVGVKGSPGINDFYSITFVPFSFPLLSGIQAGEIVAKQYPGTTTSQIIYNPMLMTVDAMNSPTLISLSYAYHPGFHAYEVSCNKGVTCALSLLFSPIFSPELQHVKISNWKNGWIAPHSGTVVIIFIPQYLEYLGLLLLVLTFTILLLYPFLARLPQPNFNEFFEKKTVTIKRKIKKVINTK